MNETVYVIHWLAKEINGDYISSMIEFASKDNSIAQSYYMQHAHKEQIMNIDGHMCEVRRHIVPVVLDQEYKF